MGFSNFARTTRNIYFMGLVKDGVFLIIARTTRNTYFMSFVKDGIFLMKSDKVSPELSR